jgi:WD40 repeat protein
MAATGFVHTASYSPDGKFFVTASGDGQARLWAAGLETMADTACQRLRRNLTQKEERQYLGTERPALTCHAAHPDPHLFDRGVLTVSPGSG